MPNVPALLLSIPNTKFIALGSYLENILSCYNKVLLRTLQIQYMVDSVYYQFLFKNTFICFPSTQPSIPTIFNHKTTLIDLIHTAISIHVQNSKFRSSAMTNLMCLGYRPSREGLCGSIRGLAAVQNHYPNTLLKHLTYQWWEKLLSVVGDELMLEIFKFAIIVVRHAEFRNQWTQVIGTPISGISNEKYNMEGQRAFPRHLIFYSNEKRFNRKRYRDEKNEKTLAREVFYGINAQFDEKEFKGRIWHCLEVYSAKLSQNIRTCPIEEILEYYCPRFPTGAANKKISPIPAWKAWAILKCLLTKIIPHSKSAGIKKLISTFKPVIFLRRKETFLVEHCLNECNIWEIWNSITINKVDLSHDAVTVHSVRDKINRFCTWIFTDLIVPILRSLFYVTDTSCHRQKILFYPHCDWEALIATPSQNILSSLFEPVSAHFNCNPSKLRLVPKEDNGFRHVINFRSLGKQVGNLRNALSVLDYYRKCESHLLGCSLLGHSDTYNVYRKFVQTANSQQQYYIIKLDVYKCFDTIPHDFLLNILNEIIRSDYYLIQKYEVLTRENGQLKVRYKRRGFPVGCQRALVEKSGGQRLFVDKIVGKRVDRTSIMRSLEDHIANNLVSFNNQIYRQKVGIPQGSILSTLLCSFFYGHLDNKYLKQFIEDPRSLLMRYIDDFIFITPSFDKMDQFVKSVYQGFLQYGIQFNLEKSLANFPHPLLPPRTLLSSAKFSWCGHFIDPISLSIGYDYSRFYNTLLADTLSINRLTPPLPTFRRYLQIYLKPRIHGIYLDEAIHKNWTKVAINIYENYLFTFAKMVCYIKDIERSKIYHFEDCVIHDAIIEILEYGLKRMKKSNAPSIIYKTNIFFTIVITAAQRVLERKRSRYHRVLTLLRKNDINTPSKDILLEIIAEGNDLLNYLKY